MLGEQVGEGSGKVTSRRVLPHTGDNPKMETSFQGKQVLLGVEVTEMGTYTSVLRPDGTLHGEGQGVLMGKKGEVGTWTGQGVGTVKKDGSISYRGAIFFRTSAAKWSRLNSVALVFEHEVDGEGNTRSLLWEWK